MYILFSSKMGELEGIPYTQEHYKRTDSRKQVIVSYLRSAGIIILLDHIIVGLG